MTHFHNNLSFLLPPRILTFGRLTVLLLSILLITASSMADTKVWVGNTDANLSTAANWSGNTAPVNNDAWEFGAVGSAGYALINNIGNGIYNSGITFTEAATGSYTISLSDNNKWLRQTGDIVNNSSFAQTINLGHELHANITINAANGDINILQNNTINLNGNNLTIDGSHNTTIAIQINHDGSLFKNGTGTLILNRPSESSTAFTGDVTINEGIVKVSGKQALGTYNSVSRTITINNGAKLTFASHDVLGLDGVRTPVKIVVDGGTIDNENGSFNTINTLTLKNGGKIVDNNGHSKWTSFQLVGTVNVTADSKLNADKISTISIGTAGSYNGVIPNGAVFNVADVTQDDSPDFIISDILTNGNGTTIAGSLTKTGAGAMTLSGANTYTGTTTVSGGKLNITGSKFNSRLIINSGATAVIDVGASGVVNMNADGFDNAVRIGHGASGSLTLESGSVTIRNSDARGKKGSINLGTNGNGNGVLTINGGTMQVDGRILMGANSGAISGTLNMNGGTLTLGVSGSYTSEGDPACGVLWFGYNKSTVNLNGGTIAMFGVKSNGPNAESSFNFNGGTLKAVADNDVDFFPAAGSMKYYINNDGAIFDTNGFNVKASANLEQGTGTGGLTKTGAGTLTLSGANTYTGVTTVSAGTLKITGSTFNSRLIIKSGSSVIIDAGENGVVSMDADAYYQSLMIGNGSNASMTIESGTVSVHNANNNIAGVQLGTNGNVTGTLTINGGSMQVDGRILMASNNDNAKGTLTINGGTLSLGVPGGYIINGDDSCGVLWFGKGTNTVNLNGGTLSMYGVVPYWVGTPKGSFNFNGGTLQAVKDNVDFFPVAGNVKNYIKQGGAIIDTQGFNVTVGAKLEQGTGENDNQGGLTKLGTGTLTLSQIPAYTGSTKIEAGTLDVPGGSTLYNLSGGKFENGQITVSSSLTVDGKLTLNNDQLSKFIGSITATEVEKTGSDTLQLCFDAQNAVNIGSLIVSSGRVDLKGYMYGSISVEGPNAVFSPGNSVGDARFGGGYELKEGATLLIEQDETGIDTLTASSFTINPNSIIEMTMGSVEPGKTYDIIIGKDRNNADVAFTDTLAENDFWNSLLTPESAYYWTLSVDGNIVRATINANAVPEPSTWALLVLGVAGLMYWRKRKN